MNSSIFASSGKAARATGAGLLAAAALLAALELAYRWSGGIPSVEPGQTPTELAWKLSRAHGEPCVVVVGDSRVGWGFSESVFDRQMRSRGEARARGFNAGLAATPLDAVVRFAAGAVRRPGLMVVALSPGSCYCFRNSLHANPARPPTLQEMADEEIGIWLRQHLTTWQRPPADVCASVWNALRGRPAGQTAYVARVTTPDGCLVGVMANSAGTPVPLAKLELSYYRSLFAEVRAHPRRSIRQRAAVVRALQAARAAGWGVVLVRLPAGRKMRALEDALPAALSPGRIAAQVGLPLLDYGRDRRTAGLPTSDESHLTADATRAFSSALADDMAASGRLVRR